VFDSSDKVENTDNIDCQDLCGNIKLPITIPDGDLPLQHSELNAKKEVVAGKIILVIFELCDSSLSTF
jgi:hypothetical protein